MRNSRFPSLHQLFGAYFHEDWDLDDPTPQAVIERFIGENPPDILQKIIRELEVLLSHGSSEEELKRLLRQDLLSRYLPPDGTRVYDWLTEIKTALQRGLTNK